MRYDVLLCAQFGLAAPYRTLTMKIVFSDDLALCVVPCLRCSVVNVGFDQAAPSNAKKISLKEVQKHDNEDDCWIAVAGKVS